MKFRYAAASIEPGAKPKQDEDSTEQFYHPDVGYSPKWPRMPTFEQFREAMRQWSDRVTVHRDDKWAYAFLDGVKLITVKCRSEL